MPLQTKPFNRLQQLQHLDLSDNQIGIKGISALLAWLKNTPTLTYLNLSGSPLNDYEYPFAQLSSAKRLANALLMLSKLQILVLAKCGLCSSHIKLLSDGIKQNPTLTHVNFNKNELENDSAELLATLLLVKKSKKLQELHLAENKIEDAGAMQLLNALDKSPDLTELNLKGNQQISEDVMGPIRYLLNQRICFPISKYTCERNRVF